MTTKNITLCALFTAVCMAVSFLESQLSFPFLPGVKLGLSNAVVLLFFAKDLVKEGIFVNIARILLSAFLFSGVFSLLFSLSGAIVSCVSVIAFKHFNCFSYTGLSIIGASLHNFTQVCVCAAVYKTSAVLLYLPVFCAIGAITGLIVGIAVCFLEKRLV